MRAASPARHVSPISSPIPPKLPDVASSLASAAESLSKAAQAMAAAAQAMSEASQGFSALNILTPEAAIVNSEAYNAGSQIEDGELHERYSEDDLTEMTPEDRISIASSGDIIVYDDDDEDFNVQLKTANSHPATNPNEYAAAAPPRSDVFIGTIRLEPVPGPSTLPLRRPYSTAPGLSQPSGIASSNAVVKEARGDFEVTETESQPGRLDETKYPLMPVRCASAMGKLENSASVSVTGLAETPPSLASVNDRLDGSVYVPESSTS
ncbi:hypothetical protein FRC07_005996, partial [Ceratobasidium sp. 392]